MRKFQQTGERNIFKAAILVFVFCFGLIPVSTFADPPPDAKVRVINCGPKFAFYAFNSNDWDYAIAYSSACLNTGQATFLKCATSDGCKVAAAPCGVPYIDRLCVRDDSLELPTLNSGTAKSVKAVGPLRNKQIDNFYGEPRMYNCIHPTPYFKSFPALTGKAIDGTPITYFETCDKKYDPGCNPQRPQACNEYRGVWVYE